MYYNTIIGWAVYYLFASFTSKLPWMSCDNIWNTDACMSVTNINFTANQTTPAKEFFELILFQFTHHSHIILIGLISSPIIGVKS